MKKIYENDSLLREIDTKILACGEEKGKAWITLEESIFFPEEGGQYADTGWLVLPSGERVRLLDGEIRKNPEGGQEIRYLVEREIPAGTPVHCVLDWEQRFSRMQQHTGEHILTGRIHAKYGYKNVGFHLSDDAPVTLDLDGPLTWEQAMEMETAANEVVWADLPVQALYPSREELAGFHYRSKIEIDGQVRLIAIGDPGAPVDLCACCAPHVPRTGKVGIIKIVSLQNYKGGVRLGILCGKRALLHYREEWKRLTDLAKDLSTGTDQVPESVAGLREELYETRRKLAEKTEEAVLRELQELPAGDHTVYFAREELPAAAVKKAFNTLTERFPGYVGVFLGSDEAGYRYSAGSRSLDARELAAAMKEKLGAKGGGSREMVQGKTTASAEQIARFWETIGEQNTEQ